MNLDSLKNAIKANPAIAASLAALLLACLALAFAHGCDMRHMNRSSTLASMPRILRPWRFRAVRSSSADSRCSTA